MHEILIISIISILFVPASAFALRKNFGKSIMVTFGFWICMIVIFDCILYYYVGKLGFLHLLWAIPLSSLFFVFVFELLKKMVKIPLESSVQKIKQLSLGNLNIVIDKKMLHENDELGVLSVSLKDLSNKMTDVISQVKTNSKDIASASMQLSSTSLQISNGANHQASSIEEVSASIEEMTSNVQQNTDNANHTSQISSNLMDGIQSASVSSGNSLKSIQEIASKIAIITDIAFQTNILALNAAVEAAHAGEQGKGFAVVASEVRKLAERSKKAADEINILANSCVESTEQTNGLMEKLVPQIETTIHLITEIVSSSNEHNQGTNQINSSIQQLTQITQQNAAASEEMSASAEELAAQAETLNESIAYFNV